MLTKILVTTICMTKQVNLLSREINSDGMCTHEKSATNKAHLSGNLVGVI